MKNVIKSTTDYSLFKLLDFKTSESHLKKIKESIDFHDCSCDYPILVNDDNLILEGRYRFIACRDMGLPIYYKVSEVTSIFDAIKIKHIYKHTDEESVCKLYCDIKQYNDILLLNDEYKIFPCGFIIRASGACSYSGWGINRKKFVLGKMDEFSVHNTRVVLNLVKWLHYDFNLCIITAEWIVDDFVDAELNDTEGDELNEDNVRARISKYRFILNKIEMISDLHHGTDERGYGQTKMYRTFNSVLRILGYLEDREIPYYSAKIAMKIFEILGVKVKNINIRQPSRPEDWFDSNSL